MDELITSVFNDYVDNFAISPATYMHAQQQPTAAYERQEMEDKCRCRLRRETWGVGFLSNRLRFRVVMPVGYAV